MSAWKGTPYLIALLAVLTSIDTMSTDMYMPALPAMKHALAITASQAQFSVSLFLVLMAATHGFLFGNLTSLAMGRAHESNAGVASSALGVTQYAAGAIAAPLAGVIGGTQTLATSLSITVFAVLAWGAFAFSGRQSARRSMSAA